MKICRQQVFWPDRHKLIVLQHCNVCLRKGEEGVAIYDMRMGKQKLKKANKKKYSHIDDLPAGNNSPKRNQPRRRRRNVTALSADDYKLRQAIEGGT